MRKNNKNYFPRCPANVKMVSRANQEGDYPRFEKPGKRPKPTPNPPRKKDVSMPNHPVLTTVKVCQLIGSVANSNAQFQIMLNSRLSKPIEQMTVGELCALVEQCEIEYNRRFDPQ